MAGQVGTQSIYGFVLLDIPLDYPIERYVWRIMSEILCDPIFLEPSNLAALLRNEARGTTSRNSPCLGAVEPSSQLRSVQWKWNKLETIHDRTCKKTLYPVLPLMAPEAK